VQIATTNGAGAVHRLIADEANVYFITSDGVMQTGVNVGGTPIMLGATTLATSLVLVDTFLYFVDQRAGSFVLEKAVVGLAESASSVASGNGTAYGLAYASGSILVARADGDSYTIARCDVTGTTGCVDALAPSVPGAPGSNMVVAPGATPSVVWADTGGDVTQMATAGSDALPLASGQALPDIVATGGAAAFWTNQESATIWSSPLDHAAPAMFTDTDYAPAGLVVDDTHVYWTAYNGATGNDVIAAPKTDGAKRIKLAAGVAARWLASNTAALFWTESSKVMKVKKPSP
jgi:hypothetical protein